MTPPDNRPIRRFVRGDGLLAQLTAANLNGHVDVTEALRKEMIAHRKPMRDGAFASEWRVGIVTDRGPGAVQTGGAPTTGSDSDDATSNRYWVKLASPAQSLESGDVFDADPRTEPGIRRTVRATNLAEADDGHEVETDDTRIVLLFRITMPTPYVEHWLFLCPVATEAAPPVLKITDTYAGAGVYKGRKVTPGTPITAIDPTQPFTAIKLGTVGSTDVIVLNLLEVGGSGHWLDPTASQVYFHGSRLQVNPDGTEVYTVFALQSDVCT